MNILVVGAGRMGLRHLHGLADNEGDIFVVDIRKDAEKEIIHLAKEYSIKSKIHFYTSLDQISINSQNIDAAILCSTANGRLEQFKYLAERGIKNILIEKPIEQSRKRFRELVTCAKINNIEVYCNLYRRTLPFFQGIRDENTPFRMIVSSGAFGFALNGLHWIDFALYMANCNKGELLWAKLDATEILSGRGSQFRDYGGIGVFQFENGSTLVLTSAADSSAPTVASVIQATRHCIIDPAEDVAILYERSNTSSKPNYLYGADYTRQEISGIETAPLWDLTAQWLRSLKKCDICKLPKLEDAVTAHELLFDLLESSGKTEFSIT